MVVSYLFKCVLTGQGIPVSCCRGWLLSGWLRPGRLVLGSLRPEIV